MNEKEHLNHLVVDDTVYKTRLSRKYETRKKWERPDPRFVRVGLPGAVRAILVKPGQRVVRGAPLIVLEAMKMQNEVPSPLDGVVAEIRVKEGQVLAKGELIALLDSQER